jgi:hypothetical protein
MAAAGGVLGGVAGMLGRGEHAAPHLRVTAEPVEQRRGGQVSVSVTVVDPAQSGRRLEVGLVCTEWYDHRTDSDVGDSDVGDSSPGSRRVTWNHTAHEQWQVVERSSGSHPLTFVVPPEAPFSYEGECLSYSWKVVVSEEVENRIDPKLEEPVWVLP